MSLIPAIGLVALLIIASPTAGSCQDFTALSGLEDMNRLTDHELSNVEGSALIFGSVNTPLHYDSISAFLNEVLWTLLGVGGRSPIATYTTVSTFVTPLPTGGIAVGLQPNTFILVKNLMCVGCTRP